MTLNVFNFSKKFGQLYVRRRLLNDTSRDYIFCVIVRIGSTDQFKFSWRTHFIGNTVKVFYTDIIKCF